MSLKTSLSFLSLSRPFFKLLLTKSFFHHRPNSLPKLPKQPFPLPILHSQTIIFDFENWLLRSSSTFPYFMIVALESCSFFRALLLLFIYPFVCCMKSETGLNLMVLVCFFGVKKEKLRIARVVLSKFFMEEVREEGFRVVRKGKRVVGVSNMPKVMVENFLKEYLEVDVVIGRELKEFCGFYTGFMEEEKMEMLINGGDAVGFRCYRENLHHDVFSQCKEIHMLTEAEKSTHHTIPKSEYPKPLIFHDGRIAFLPTFSATLSMFIWLPFGLTLSIFRHFIGILFPYNLSIPIFALTGMVNQHTFPPAQTQPKPTSNRLYISNHRTLLDPIYISLALKKQVTAVVYSVSPISEFISPIKTTRLSRNKKQDREKMEKLLKQGDLVVCPEGTTCREPYLLRFSPLFAELADRVTPVALNTNVTMFYGTTANGLKWMDSFFFLMNPRPKYLVRFIEDVCLVLDDGKRCGCCEVANRVQREIGCCLGFKCTMLTRKDKYQMLVGNDGVV